MSSKPRHSKLEKSCPLEKTHTRLHHVHDAWHRVQDNYADPDAFVASINEALVTLRSVSFMLQKERSLIPDFDAWYEPHIERYAADPLMTWLKKSRNRVEKEGDLEMNSSARVRLLGGPVGLAHIDIEVPPLLTQQDIAKHLLGRFPEAAKHQALLSVERRWVAADLPDLELLDVLAHGYGVVAEVVADGHRQCGVIMRNFGDEDHDHRHRRRQQLGGRLSCMVAHANARTAYGHLAAGRLVEIGSRTKDISREDIEGFDLPRGMAAAAPFHVRGRHLLDQAEGLNGFAKEVVAEVGTHEPMAFVFPAPDDVPLILHLHPRDYTTQTLMMEAVANEAEQAGAAGVVFLTILLHPDERPDELLVAAVTEDGGERQWRTPLRPLGKGKHAIAGESVRDDAVLPFMHAVTRCWAARAETA